MDSILSIDYFVLQLSIGNRSLKPQVKNLYLVFVQDLTWTRPGLDLNHDWTLTWSGAWQFYMNCEFYNGNTWSMVLTISWFIGVSTGSSLVNSVSKFVASFLLFCKKVKVIVYGHYCKTTKRYNAKLTILGLKGGLILLSSSSFHFTSLKKGWCLIASSPPWF